MEINPSSVSNKDFPGNIKHFYRSGNCLYFEADNTVLEVSIISNEIIRFRFNQNYFAKDFSYAIDPQLITEDLAPEVGEDEKHFKLATSQVGVLIEKANLKIRIEDLSGNVICEDENGYHWEPNAGFGGNYVYCSKHIQNDECFYGLGDKPHDLNLRGKRFLNWGTDTYGFAKEQDPLYRNMPFYYGLQNGIGYGIFFDNSFQTFFDFGHENHEIASFWAEGGEMSYYFIAGPELMNVAERFVQLTGKPELPPLWALGYHQSKWSYFPESKVKEIANEMRSRRFPCDVIHLDIDYMDGFRCFTWNHEHFPDPDKMIRELEADGFKTVVIVDPGIKIDSEYYVYQEAFKKEYFCKRQDGDLMTGKVWPGDCNFPDFTNPEVRKWWAGLMKFYTKSGVAGVWNDMNEPAVFEIGTFPDDVRHSYDGLDVSHRRAHNVYGMEMARSTYEGLKLNASKKRPFVLTRSGFSGVQRYSAIWTGDNISSWEHLWIANVQCQRLSVSGVSFCGTDIGGFIGEPDGELFVRYIQMAVFHPFFRGHSSNDHGNKEPWTFGPDYENQIREAIELRYQLLPYIYTTFYQYVINGTPMIRPVAFIDQHHHDSHLRMDEFGFGDHLLVCPVKESKAGTRKVYLPSGNWYNYWNGKQIKGGHEISVHTPLNQFPLFVRAGAVLPHFPVIQHTGETVDELTLHVYFSVNRYISYIYTDENEGYNYQSGKYLYQKVTVFGNRRQLRMVFESDGKFALPYKNLKIVIHGLPFVPKAYDIDGKQMNVKTKNKKGVFSIVAGTGLKRLRVFH